MGGKTICLEEGRGLRKYESEGVCLGEGGVCLQDVQQRREVLVGISSEWKKRSTYRVKR